MMYNLFLDDMRNPNKFLNDIRTWEVAKNYYEFITIIKNRGLPQFISFDHDLPYENPEWPEEKTGYDCAKWLIEYCMRTGQKLPDYQVHSMNPVGKKNIEAILSNYENVIEKVDYD
jgi:hypothetical protein